MAEDMGKYPWWLQNSLFSIPELWSLPTLQKVRVAILDTGISEHVDFDFSVITGYNYLEDSTDFQHDVFGHGTHCAGIIAAKGIKSYGIAPDTELFIAKVCDDFGRPVLTAVKNALNDIYLDRNTGNDVKIINMSLDLVSQGPDDDQLISDIESLLGKLILEKHCLVICAAGDFDDDHNSFPARLGVCIAAGSISSNLLRSSFSRTTPILGIMAPGDGILSSGDTDSTRSLSGTSQAAAFVTGVCSLVIQKMPDGSFSSDTLKKFLFQTAYSDSFSPTEYGNGIIQPNKLMEAIKEL